MKYCNNCKVKVNTERKTCPLCFENLESKEETTLNKFPSYSLEVQRSSLWYRVLVFVCINFSLASIVCNYLFYENYNKLWSLVVVLSILLFLYFLNLVIYSKKNFAQKLLLLVIASIVVIICIDLVFSSNYKFWSTTYILPFAPALGLVITLFITVVNSKKYMDYFAVIVSYILLLFLPSLIGVISNEVIYQWWPAVTSLAIGISVIFGIFIFPKRKTEQEIKKRLHV